MNNLEILVIILIVVINTLLVAYFLNKHRESLKGTFDASLERFFLNQGFSQIQDSKLDDLRNENLQLKFSNESAIIRTDISLISHNINQLRSDLEKLTFDMSSIASSDNPPRKSLFISPDGSVQADSLPEFLRKMMENGLIPPPNNDNDDLDRFTDDIDKETPPEN